ncbi:transposase [Aneurinibacillus sp. REN35]|uniref:transposase n=1 Tax=Aneurinibacillus sp. REN35 TaxID=3237286 RepID=UPI00352767FC
MRKKYSLQFKHTIVQEVIKGAQCSAVARKYQVSSLVIYRWVRMYKQDQLPYANGISK